MKHKMAQYVGDLTDKNTLKMETTVRVTPGEKEHNNDITNIASMCNKQKSIDLIEDQYEEEFDRIMQEQENQEHISDEAIIRDIVNSVNKTKEIKRYEEMGHDSQPSTPESKDQVTENTTEVKPPSICTKTVDEPSELNNSESSESIEQKTETVTISPSISRKTQHYPSKPNDCKPSTLEPRKPKIEKITTAKPSSISKKTEDYPLELNPFAEDDNEACSTNPFGDSDNETDKTGNSTNPFGDSDNETDKREHGTNPFGDSDDEEEIPQKEPTPKPMPRRKHSAVKPLNNNQDNTIKLPVPLPRMLSRSTPVTPNQSPLLNANRSFRLPGSSSSLGGANASAYNSIRRKKKPAPPPPKNALPSQAESLQLVTVSATSNNLPANITSSKTLPSPALSSKTTNSMTPNNQPPQNCLPSETSLSLATPIKSNTRPRKSRMAPPPPPPTLVAASGAHKSPM